MELARKRAQDLLRHTGRGRVFDLDFVRLRDRLREQVDVVEDDKHRADRFAVRPCAVDHQGVQRRVRLERQLRPCADRSDVNPRA